MTGGTDPGAGKGPGLFSSAYRQVVLALLAGVALVSYNNMAATAALPDIGEDLGSVALLPWVITVELLAAAIAVLAVGPYIDGSGASRTFRVTIVGFAVASFLCAAAPTMELLVAARVLQGLGTGALLGTAITSIGLIADDRIRPRIYAVVSAMWGVMSVGGPALAAGLVGALGWRSVFAVNLPVAAAAGAVGWRKLPEQAAADPERLDRRGLLLASAATVAPAGRLLLGRVVEPGPAGRGGGGRRRLCPPRPLPSGAGGEGGPHRRAPLAVAAHHVGPHPGRGHGGGRLPAAVSAGGQGRLHRGGRLLGGVAVAGVGALVVGGQQAPGAPEL